MITMRRCGAVDVPQLGVLDRDAGHPRGALRIGDVAGQAVWPHFLEREGHRDQPAVELGDRDLGGGVQRGQPLVAFGPLGPRRGQAQALQDRDVQAGQRADVPVLVGAAGARGGGNEPAGGEHGDDDHVRGAQGVDQRGFGRAQRGAEHRERASTGRLDGVGEGVHEAGVSRHVMGAVVQDSDDGTVCVRGLSFEDAPGRRSRRRLEPLAGERDRVRQEPRQLAQVLWPAVREVGVRLGDHAARNGRQPHELGVGGRLTAEHDHRHARRRDGVQTVWPGLASAEEADDDGGRARQQRGQIVDFQAGRVGQPVAGPAGPGRQQVGVRGGEQDDHGSSCQRSAGRTQRPGPAGGRVAHSSGLARSWSESRAPYYLRRCLRGGRVGPQLRGGEKSQ